MVILFRRETAMMSLPTILDKLTVHTCQCQRQSGLFSVAKTA